jgi:hypothetical protein
MQSINEGELHGLCVFQKVSPALTIKTTLPHKMELENLHTKMCPPVIYYKNPMKMFFCVERLW